MILSFIDESGTGLKDRRTAFFVLAALSINASESQAMDVNLATLKRRLVGWARPEDYVEIRNFTRLFPGQSGSTPLQMLPD